MSSATTQYTNANTPIMPILVMMITDAPNQMLVQVVVASQATMSARTPAKKSGLVGTGANVTERKQWNAHVFATMMTAEKTRQQETVTNHSKSSPI